MSSASNFRVAGFVQNLAMKAPCQTFSTGNLTLSGIQTVNGVLLEEGDRVLVKDQTDPIENGIYTAETSAWARDGDWDGGRDVVGGTLVPAYRVSDGFMVLWQADGAPDQLVPSEDPVVFTSYFDPAGIPVAVNLQEVTDDGNTTTNTIETTTAGVKIDVRDGGSIRVREAADIDSFSIVHDGTSARLTTTSGSIVSEEPFIVEGGNALIAQAAAGGDTIQMSHDGTDANITCAATLDLNFTGASVGYKFDESVYIAEKAAANADFATLGQFWVRNDTPNTAMFTDDAGNDIVLSPSGGVGGTQIGVVFAGYVNAAASAEVVPSGWSVAVGGAGLYVITHNLGLNDVDDLSVVAMPEEAGQTQCSSDAQGTNTFDVTVISSDVGSSQDWWFIATLNVAQ